jgi:hypothetical protein
MRHQMPVSVGELAGMRPAQRDEVFRNSPAGPVPTGIADGMALLPLGRVLTKVAARLIRIAAWQGKVFDADGRELGNRITPFGIRAIKADVYPGPSWLDRRDCIVLDYSRTSLVARWVRDEIREVAPRTYLGLVFVRRRKLLHFTLTFKPSA